jgi:hypothetical protein
MPPTHLFLGTTTTTSLPQPSSVVANIIYSPAHPHFQVSLFLIFFNTLLMAGALTRVVSAALLRRWPLAPPPTLVVPLAPALRLVVMSLRRSPR